MVRRVGDTDTLVTRLWATELGLGVLEAFDVELAKPTTWQSLVRTILEPRERGAPAGWVPNAAVTTSRR